MIPGPNWARRYGHQHQRLCARPGCGAPAAATLRFLPTQREAWLVDLDDDAVRTEGDLCARHASALVLPRGWELHDERARTSAAEVESRMPHRRARVRKRTLSAVRARRSEPSHNVPLPMPETETEVAADPPALPAPPAPAASPAAFEATPEADAEVTGEKLADVLDAQTPLLKRAFQNVLPADPEA